MPQDWWWWLGCAGSIAGFSSPLAGWRLVERFTPCLSSAEKQKQTKSAWDHGDTSSLQVSPAEELALPRSALGVPWG